MSFINVTAKYNYERQQISFVIYRNHELMKLAELLQKDFERKLKARVNCCAKSTVLPSLRLVSSFNS